MTTFHRLSAVAALWICSAFITAVQGQEVPSASFVQGSEGEIVILHLDQQFGTPMVDLLALFGDLLDLPIAYRHEAVGSRRVHIVGELKIQRRQLALAFEAILRAYDFGILREAEAELLTVRAVESNIRRALVGVPHSSQILIPLCRLHESLGKANTLYSTVFPLQHVDAGLLMTAFRCPALFNGEAVRKVRGSQAIMVTANSLGALREIRDLVERMDVESSGLARVEALPVTSPAAASGE